MKPKPDTFPTFNMLSDILDVMSNMKMTTGKIARLSKHTWLTTIRYLDYLKEQGLISGISIPMKHQTIQYWWLESYDSVPDVLRAMGWM